MADCTGDIPAATKVDESMNGFLDEEAARLGVSKAELYRRLFDLYRESRENDSNCPHCGEPITITLDP